MGVMIVVRRGSKSNAKLCDLETRRLGFREGVIRTWLHALT